MMKCIIESSAAVLCFLLFAVSAHVILPEDEPPEEAPEQVIECFNVQTDIRYRFATTRMVSVVRNTAGVAKEMAFDVTLPKEAFIVSFAMTIDGKVYDGEVKEKTEAKEQYNRAVQQGQSAGHIRQAPRHSNRFDVSVNVANGTAVNFTLTYQEILVRKFGQYEYEMHVKPGQAVKDFNVEVFIQENRPLHFVKTPALRKGSVMTNSIEKSNDLTVIDQPSDTSAHIRYKPTINQQGSGGLAARFVVQYDVEHADKGDLLVVDGFFLHLFSPSPSMGFLPKDIVFVLDQSGSMSGTKISQLKEAMNTILGDLNEEDRFNILPFSSDVSKWKSYLTQATPDIIEEATAFVDEMQANGGTNINSALLMALDELNRREVKSRVGMVFFLTDGQATSGETGSKAIAANVLKNNDNDVAIYSLAFGKGADFESMKTISTQNSGFARKIYEASDAALQVESLYKEISIVSLKNVSVEYLPGVTKTTETEFPVVFNGSEIMICGPWPYTKIDFEAIMRGSDRKGEVDLVLEIDDINDVTLTSEDLRNPFFSMPRDYTSIVEKMWAFLTIKQMLKEKQRAIEDETLVEELNKDILEMSLKYKFVTPLTSMVVTKPETGEDDKPIETGLKDVDDEPLLPSQYQPGTRYHSITKSGASFAMSYPMSASRYPPQRAYGPSGRKRGKTPRTQFLMHGLPGRRLSRPSSPAFDLGSTNASKTKMSGYKPRPTRPPTSTSFATSRPTTSKPRRNNKKGNKNGKRGKKMKQAKFGILRSIVFRSDQASVCLAPKKITSGKYTLVGADNGLKIQLETECLSKKCRVQPKKMIITSSGRTSVIDLTNLSAWQLSQHPDFSMTIEKLNKMILDHKDMKISITRTRRGKKMFFSIELMTKLQKTYSGMIEVMTSKKFKRGKKQKVPKGCKNENVDGARVVKSRHLSNYKV